MWFLFIYDSNKKRRKCLFVCICTGSSRMIAGGLFRRRIEKWLLVWSSLLLVSFAIVSPSRWISCISFLISLISWISTNSLGSWFFSPISWMPRITWNSILLVQRWCNESNWIHVKMIKSRWMQNRRDGLYLCRNYRMNQSRMLLLLHRKMKMKLFYRLVYIPRLTKWLNRWFSCSLLSIMWQSKRAWAIPDSMMFRLCLYFRRTDVGDRVYLFT